MKETLNQTNMKKLMLTMGLAAISAIGFGQTFKTTLFDNSLGYRYEESTLVDCHIQDLVDMFGYNEARALKMVKLAWSHDIVPSFKITQIVTESDTMFLWSMFYQNARYSHITDLGSITFTSKESVLKFADDLDQIFQYSKETGVDIDGRGYRLNKRESATSIIVWDEDSKYFYLNHNVGVCLSNEIRNTAYLMGE